MNRGKKAPLLPLLILAGLLAAVFVLKTAVDSADKRLGLLKGLSAEMTANRAGYLAMAEETRMLKTRAAESRNRNFITELEKTAAEFGLSRNLKKIQFINHREDGQVKSDDYEIRFEAVEMNRALNLLYRIANGGLLVKIRKCALAVSFENPSLLNINLIVAHIR